MYNMFLNLYSIIYTRTRTFQEVSINSLLEVIRGVQEPQVLEGLDIYIYIYTYIYMYVYIYIM